MRGLSGKDGPLFCYIWETGLSDVLFLYIIGE